MPSDHEPRLDELYSLRSQKQFLSVLRRRRPSVVIISYIRLANLVSACSRAGTRRPVTMIDTFDVMSARCRQFQEAGEKHWVNITEEEEREVLRQFDYVLAIQNNDAAQFRDMLPGDKILTVGHACPAVRHPARDTSPVVLTYVATSGAANRRALADFLTNVWPTLVERAGGNVSLQIVGRVGKSVPADSVGDVRVLGEVEDLADVYAQTDVCVNPVIFGGGLKIKNVEALANGKPLVTTGVGAEGLEDGTGHAFFVCETAEMMVKQLSALVGDSDLRQRMSERAYDYAEAHFSQTAAYGELRRVLEESAA